MGEIEPSKEKVKMKIWFAGVPGGGWTKSEKP